jgi:hypothetical protein
MVLDRASLQLHHLDKIHLIALRRRTRIFPHQGFAVGEVLFLVPAPLRRLSLEDAGGKSANFFPPSQYAAFRASAGAHWADAELHRLSGELLSRLPSPDWAEVEKCLRAALAVARTRQPGVRVARGREPRPLVVHAAAVG